MSFVNHYLMDPATAKNSPGDKTEDNSGEGDYSVEYILGHRVDPKRKIIHYLVKWEGYAHNLDSWVPDFDFHDDGNMIETYHNALKASTAKNSPRGQKTPASATRDKPMSAGGKRKSLPEEDNVPSSKKSAKNDWPVDSAQLSIKTEIATDYDKVPWSEASSIKKAIQVLGSWDNYISRVKRVDNKADPSNTDKMLYRVTVEFKPNALKDPKEVYCAVPLGTARQRLPQAVGLSSVWTRFHQHIFTEQLLDYFLSTITFKKRA
ncbi:hypothetical protein HDU83_005864 [Entophlyctis luteolus]|nr:hypothetical protein HDU83_005864 [Entophlyctis luteolus]KAJ3380534.1 hypothetical protein HDU84_005752 [Entophlyctis sp. JEL0112]